MEISVGADTLTDRVKQLDLTAQTYEEQRILKAILEGITCRGEFVITVPQPDGDRVIQFSFKKK